MYRVVIEKKNTGYHMTYGIYDTFFEASEACKYVKSINSIDYIFIEETRYNSGLNKRN